MKGGPRTRGAALPPRACRRVGCPRSAAPCGEPGGKDVVLLATRLLSCSPERMRRRTLLATVLLLGLAALAWQVLRHGDVPSPEKRSEATPSDGRPSLAGAPRAVNKGGEAP